MHCAKMHPAKLNSQLIGATRLTNAITDNHLQAPLTVTKHTASNQLTTAMIHIIHRMFNVYVSADSAAKDARRTPLGTYHRTA